MPPAQTAVKTRLIDCVRPSIRHDVTEFDPTTHVNSWRTAWRSLTKKAGLPGFRFHDLRHCVITSLAESGAPDSVIMGIAGHVSRRMLERYSHVRMETKRQLLKSSPISAKGRVMAQTMTQTSGLRLHLTMSILA